MKSKRVAKKFAVNLVIFLSLIAVLGVFVMLLWNALVPELFGGPALTYWQAAGVLLLSHILLRGTPYYGVRARRNARCRERMRARWAQMTSEERAAINNELGIPSNGTPTRS
jgi:hypothetical protein